MGNFDVNITNFSALSEDMSSLYLNKKHSDITLNINGEEIYTHKAILVTRSGYFESALSNNLEELELKILDVSNESVHDLLKYMYTGTILLTPSNVLDLLTLAYKLSVKSLEIAIIKQSNFFINLKNVCLLLNAANSYDLADLRDCCHTFMDKHALDILDNDCFLQLSELSLIKLLQRDSFFAPEIGIFINVAKWCEANNHEVDLISRCVRLSWLSVEDIIQTVWPTKLVDNEKLLHAVGESMDIKPKLVNCRAKLEVDENLATLQKGAKVCLGIDPGNLLTGNRDHVKNAEHKIPDDNGIIFEFGQPSIINNIRMMMWNKSAKYYCNYYIEISLDYTKWKKIIDFTQYSCRSEQHLFFEPEIATYVRVMGTYNSICNAFYLAYFEAYFKSSIPKFINGVLYPTANVATIGKKAIVIEGTNPDNLLNGITTDYLNVTYHIVGSGAITIQLAQPYMLSSMKFLIYDKESQKAGFSVETSVNKSDWVMVADRRFEEQESWQTIRFPERAVVYIKITGTAALHNLFVLVHFECPAASGEKKLE